MKGQNRMSSLNLMKITKTESAENLKSTKFLFGLNFLKQFAKNFLNSTAISTPKNFNTKSIEIRSTTKKNKTFK